MRSTLLALLLALGVIGWPPPLVRAQATDDAETRRLEPAVVLRALSFDESGTFAGPASRDFWERVFDDDRIPDNPERELRGIDDAPLIDAAYVLAATSSGPPATGRARLRAMAFVQRVFGDRGGRDLAPVLVAARAAIRYPMLMLSVERMGIEDARVYTSLARVADRLERINQPLLLRNALSQFQGAVALVERARLAGSMAPDVAGASLLALAAAPITRDGEFDGAVGRWLVEQLLPGVGVRGAPSFDSDAMDQQLLAALAGAGAAAAERPVVEWEGLTFHFDRRAAQFERLIRTRDRLGGNRLDAVLALSAVATALASGAGTDPGPLVEQLERSVTSIRAPHVGIYVPNARSVAYEDRIRPIVEELREIARRGRLRRLPAVAQRLRPVVDVLLADLLRTLPYVVHLANSYALELLGGDIAARHEFGVRIGDRMERVRAPWSIPRGGAAPPVPFHRLGEFWTLPEGDDRFTEVWHVYGALMSLDLAFASFYLPRLASVIPPETPAFSPVEEAYFAQGVALFNPTVVTGTQIGEIADAIRRGRGRVQQLRARSGGAGGDRARGGAELPAKERTRVDAAVPFGGGGPVSFADRTAVAGSGRRRKRGGAAAGRMGSARRLAGWVSLRAASTPRCTRPLHRFRGATGFTVCRSAARAGRSRGRSGASGSDCRGPAADGDARDAGRCHRCPARTIRRAGTLRPRPSAGTHRGLRGSPGWTGAPATPDRVRAGAVMGRKSRLSSTLAVCFAILCPLTAFNGREPGVQDANPVLTIVEPGPQTPLVGVVRMRAEVVPAAGVRSVEFFVNGVPACTASAPTPFECSWNAGDSADARIVRVVARLASGGRLVRSMRTRGRPAALFSTGTNAILVPIVVQDRRGRFVDDLTLDDFALFEDGVQQAPSFFEAANIPLDLVLTVDFSSSMTGAMGALQFAARHFIRELPEPARLGLLAFNDRVFLMARQEENRAAVMRAIDALPAPFGGTALLDAISYALDLHGDAQAHRVVVLFSDGDDRHSFSAIDAVEERLRESETTVYVVTMGRGRAIERVRELLGRLTRVSGGRSFSIDRIDELDEVLAHIRDRLQNRYFLAYQPSNPARDGTWRSIEVRTSNRRHVVTAREGYVADP